MAGDWIKLQVGTPHKPEVLTMAEMLGVSRREMVGVLVDFLCWLDTNARHADVTHVSRKSLDDVLNCHGLAACLESVGWVSWDDLARTMTIANYDRHNGESSKNRALATERKRNQRSRDDRDESVTREEKKRDTSLRSVGARRIPEGWEPSIADVAFAKERLRADRVLPEVESFRTYWRGAVKNATSPDWSAKWRTWVLKASNQFHVPAAGGPRRVVA